MSLKFKLLAFSCLIISSASLADSNARMIGGSKGNLENSPFLLLSISNNSGEANCTGTLVGPHQILTAAHCVDDVSDPAGIKVKIGGQDITPVAIKIADGYSKSAVSDANSAKDVAIISFDAQVSVTPIKIAKNTPINTGMEAFVIGYGLMETEASPEERDRAGKIKISRVTSGIFESEFSTSGVAVCGGDSGGPVLKPSGQGSLDLIGVSSLSTADFADGKTCKASSGDATSTYANVQNSSVQALIAQFPEIASGVSGGGNDGSNGNIGGTPGGNNNGGGSGYVSGPQNYGNYYGQAQNMFNSTLSLGSVSLLKVAIDAIISTLRYLISFAQPTQSTTVKSVISGLKSAKKKKNVRLIKNDVRRAFKKLKTAK